MTNEFKVIVEIPLEESLKAEICSAIKAAVLEKLGRELITDSQMLT
jgi:hypothetical protein